MSKSNQVITPPNKFFLAIDTNGRFTLSKAVWVALGEPEDFFFRFESSRHNRLFIVQQSGGKSWFQRRGTRFEFQSLPTAKKISQLLGVKPHCRLNVEISEGGVLICTP